MTVTPSATELEIGESLAVSALVNYNNGTQKTINSGMTITAEPQDAITTSGNTITVVKGGTITVYVTYEGIIKSFTVIAKKEEHRASKVM